MDKTVSRGRIGGEVTAPASKSYAQRAAAAALLSDGISTLTHLTLCNDTSAALGVIHDLGAQVAHEQHTYTIEGGLDPRSGTIDIGESGLSARLFTPIAAMRGQQVAVNGSGSILTRPIRFMEEPLRALGARIETRDGFLPLTIEGPMQGGEALIDGSHGSQFVSGLLMALPLAAKDTVLTVEGLTSRPYIDMTLEVLDTFGIEAGHNEYRQFYIPGGQRYTAATYNIEGDWSGASCLLVAGAVAGEITVHNLDQLSRQADRAIIEALQKAGAEIFENPESITVRKAALRAFEFDATHCPDLFPALAALAANCEGTSVITGTHRLTHKESNRAETIAGVFRAMDIDVDLSEPDRMRITGGPIGSAEVSSHNDHRIAMAAAVAALNSDGSVTIRQAEAVGKSYPCFWEDLEGLKR